MPALAARELAHSRRFAAIAALLGRKLLRHREEVSNVLQHMGRVEAQLAAWPAREATGGAERQLRRGR